MSQNADSSTVISNTPAPGYGCQHPKTKCYKKDSKGFKGTGQQDGVNDNFGRDNGALAGKTPNKRAAELWQKGPGRQRARVWRYGPD
ncbi:hypothetical protein FKM82_023028 [Ascaphus truei]